METVLKAKSFGGIQGVYKHASAMTGTEMTFSVFTPPQAETAPCPVVYYLAGLTGTPMSVIEKGNIQRVCAELGLILVAPDTSPRGEDVPNDPAVDLGQGAGFYIDADEAPWSTNFRMHAYVTEELSALIGAQFPADLNRQGIMGHSMGGHGALTLALKNPGKYRSVSAFAPIASAARCPWGAKAFTGYFGADERKWRTHDATLLIEDGARLGEVLVDTGEDDPFLIRELNHDLFRAACERAGIPLTLRMQPGYDHSYYFVASFMEDHLRWHAARL